jgi:hypothetical protein
VTKVFEYSGSFAGDKDAAARLREDVLKPRLAENKTVVLDFRGVELATQSFMHALLAQTVRDDPASLEHVTFKNCNPDVQSLVEIVVDYAQEDFMVEDD